MRSEPSRTSCGRHARLRDANAPFRLGRPHRRRRGAAVVEFALVVPVFLLVIFGILELGRMIMVQQVLTNASREGARIAILDGATVSGVESAVSNYLAGASVSGATVGVTPDPLSGASAGDPVTVVVSIPFSQVSWVQAGSFINSVNLSGSSVMRREGLP